MKKFTGLVLGMLLFEALGAQPILGRSDTDKSSNLLITARDLTGSGNTRKL